MPVPHLPANRVTAWSGCALAQLAAVAALTGCAANAPTRLPEEPPLARTRPSVPCAAAGERTGAGWVAGPLTVEGRAAGALTLEALVCEGASVAVEPPDLPHVELAPHGLPALLVPSAPPVHRQLARLQHRHRDSLAVGFERARRYLPLVQRVLREEGLPLDLAFVPLVESTFDPAARSSGGAAGLWQLIGPTARHLGLRTGPDDDERTDPLKATRAAARYLRELNTTFGGDWLLTLAAYNAGPSRVRRGLRRTQSGDFWALSQTPGALPARTRDYVPTVLATILIARDAERYGFEQPSSASVGGAGATDPTLAIEFGPVRSCHRP